MLNGQPSRAGLVKMGKFASPKVQAESVIDELKQRDSIVSLGTARNYKQGLTRVAEFTKDINISLRDLTKSEAELHLAIRGEFVGQKTLDMERQAIQAMMHMTGNLTSDKKLYAVSEKKQILTGRAYRLVQVQIISERQQEKNKLATEIAYAAGLRAHELFTLLPVLERSADKRPALETKFQGRNGKIYTVIGKGGLVREVMIPHHLALRLEEKRLIEPVKVLDRDIYYTQYYLVNGGNKFSSSFTQLAKKILGWSSGAHGLRHSYAQERMEELQKLGMTRSISLETVSQEMGHFRPNITETYLR